MKSVQVQIMHSPTLNTVLMVERTLEQAGELMKLSELKAKLPRKVMHSTLLLILDYLQQSGKIFVSARGIVWVYRPPAEMEKLKARGLEL